MIISHKNHILSHRQNSLDYFVNTNRINYKTPGNSLMSIIRGLILLQNTVIT